MVERAPILKTDVGGPGTRRRQPAQLPRCRNMAMSAPGQHTALKVEQPAVITGKGNGAVELSGRPCRTVLELPAEPPTTGQVTLQVLSVHDWRNTGREVRNRSFLQSLSAQGGIRTRDLPFRRGTLYPAELLTPAPPLAGMRNPAYNVGQLRCALRATLRVGVSCRDGGDPA